MHYVLGYVQTTRRITFFYATEDYEEAMSEGSRVGAVRTPKGQPEKEVAIVEAPDLYAVYQNHPHFFDEASSRPLIKDCFFCRAYLKGESPRMSEVDHLTQEALRHGHCLLCHSLYPVVGKDGGTYLTAALRVHAMDCTTRDIRNSPQ